MGLLANVLLATQPQEAWLDNVPMITSSPGLGISSVPRAGRPLGVVDVRAEVIRISTETPGKIVCPEVGGTRPYAALNGVIIDKKRIELGVEINLRRDEKDDWRRVRTLAGTPDGRVRYETRDGKSSGVMKEPAARWVEASAGK